VIALGAKKLNTYFTILVHEPDVSYYLITTVLKPALHFNWFQTQWKHYPHWVTKAQKLLKKVFDDYVKQDAAANNNELREPPPSCRKLPATDLYSPATAVDTHLLTGFKNKCQCRPGQVDEYFEALYADLNTTNEQEWPLLEEPFEWWRTYGQNQYPILFKTAADHLAIPSTSCNCERAFSSAQQTITDDQNRLSGNTIEALQLQKNWVRRGVVKSYINNLTKQVEILTKTSIFGLNNSVKDSSFSSSQRSVPPP
jgi:hypothetical protein